MADRFFSVDSFDAFKEHLSKYWITEPISGVNLKLDIIGDETLTADNDVTDHYVESNIAYQDQVSLKPKVYTIQGEVGELVWYQKDSVSQKVGQVAQRLEGVVSFLPTRSRSFQQMKSKVMKAAQWVDTASNIWDRFDSLTPEMTNQQQAYNWLLFWRNMRAPILVNSPWGILSGFVITSLTFSQSRETKDKSTISITLKEFRTTSVTTVKFDKDKYQGNAMQENEPKKDNGVTAGDDVSPSTTDKEGNPVCVVSTEDKSTYDIRYDYKSKDLIIYDEKNLQMLSPNSHEYEDAITAMYRQCGDSIEDLNIHGWGVDK